MNYHKNELCGLDGRWLGVETRNVAVHGVERVKKTDGERQFRTSRVESHKKRRRGWRNLTRRSASGTCNMTNIPPDLKYSKTHEWLRSLPDGSIEVGITDHAQEALGDLISVDLLGVGRRVAAAELYATVESVMTAVRGCAI